MKTNTASLPVPELTLPISLETYQQLLVASAKTGYRKEIWEIGAAAIHEWLARNEPEAFGRPVIKGHQWKQLFLPNGTLLRTSFNGKNFYSLVEDDQLIYKGAVSSPSQFANCVGGVRRNAWKVIWVLFPNTTLWRTAVSLRTQRTKRM
ncbi:hypothetical protein GCM10027321_05460 [Massilia terrae]|uniref:Uncharacterized protein n=1 Tax=Massilia terrae TaxID=1811224 RepID=A0ABT2CTD7_9BURK|nr:hypothetical protein [Massilia terrae]MCS0657094.1 hypothetical protein [Massilia terrae]